jgi:hypothetical protein
MIEICNQGEEIQLDLLLAIGLTLRLYKTTDVTAGLTRAQINALTEASFTEATFTGYTSKALTGGSWVTTQGDPATGTYAQQTFTSTANQTAQTIYGYYVTRTSDGKLVWHERFTGPFVVSLNTDSIQITPTFTLDDDQEATVAARGLVASQILTTSGSVFVTTTATTDMFLNNFDADGTRNYRIGVNANLEMVGTGNWSGRLLIDGIDQGRLWAGTSVSGTTFGLMAGHFLWQPATAQYDLMVGFGLFSGSATIQLVASAAVPRELWIEDIGPR